MLKMTFPKVIDVVQAKMKNRRMQIKRYSDNSYLVQFKRLAKDLDGRLATPVERMVLSNEAFEILIGGGLTLIERKNRKSRKEGEGMVRCKFTGKGEVKFPHDNPDLCPTYFDGCNCLATSLEQMSAIANDAQLEAGDLEDEVKRLRAIIEGLECVITECENEHLSAQMSGFETGWEHPNTQTMWKKVLGALEQAKEKMGAGK